MRLVQYGIINENTKAITKVGCNQSKANEKLAEMQKANPKGNYKVIYKWVNI